MKYLITGGADFRIKLAEKLLKNKKIKFIYR